MIGNVAAAAEAFRQVKGDILADMNAVHGATAF